MSSLGPGATTNRATGVAHEQLSDQVRSAVLTVNPSDNKTSEKTCFAIEGGHGVAGRLAGRRVGRSRLALTTVIWPSDRTGHPVRRSLLAYDH